MQIKNKAAQGKYKYCVNNPTFSRKLLVSQARRKQFPGKFTRLSTNKFVLLGEEKAFSDASWQNPFAYFGCAQHKLENAHSSSLI